LDRDDISLAFVSFGNVYYHHNKLPKPYTYARILFLVAWFVTLAEHFIKGMGFGFGISPLSKEALSPLRLITPTAISYCLLGAH
jgi:hypothetical protein